MAEPRQVAIEVLDLRRVDGAGNLKAFAKVRLGAVVIHGCRVIQQAGQKAWLALPQTPGRRKADGTGAGWFPVIEITRRELMDQLRDAVLAEWEAKERRVEASVQDIADTPFADDWREAVADLEGRGR